MSNQPPAGPPHEWSQAGPPPPAKKRKKWPFIVAGIVVLIVIISVASQGGSSDDSSTTADSTTAATTATAAPQSGEAAPPPAAETTTTTKAKAKHTLVYEVTGDSGTATNITYFGTGGNQSQETDATLPFRKEITADSKSDFVIKGVTAQNGGDGAITCKITVDGKVETENSSNGQYAVVSCNGKLF